MVYNYKLFEEHGLVLIELPHIDDKKATKIIPVDNRRFTVYTILNVMGFKKPANSVQAKKVFIEAGNMVGVSIKTLVRVVNSCAYKFYMQDNKDLHYRFAYSKVGFSLATIVLVNKQSNIVRQYQKDGNDHLAGYGIVIGPADRSKKVLGKGLWRRLCNNSKYRNDLIVRYLINYRLRLGTIPDTTIKTIVDCLNILPSTVLRKHTILIHRLTSIAERTPMAAATIFKYLDGRFNYSDTDFGTEFGNLLNIYVDCHHMLGQNFNHNWSMRRVIREHDAIPRANNVLTKEDDNEPFSLTHKLPLKIDDGDLVAELITTAADLWALGHNQRHCVGSYGNYVKNEQYVVYKITDKKGKVSTLGIPLVDYLHPQHYHACNKPVTDEDRIRLAEKVITIVKRKLGGD